MKKFHLLLLLLAGCQQTGWSPSVTQLDAPKSQLYLAVSMLSEEVAWVSGDGIVRTTDEGMSWQAFKHPTDSFQFRDIHGLSDSEAIVLSSGTGSQSRIFTFQAPDQWEENFVMQDSLGFLDCMDFWDETNGIAYGDAIDAHPYILLTTDGGKSWKRAPTDQMPKAGQGEGGFASSGTCVETGENGKAWIATGAGGNSRVLITEDYGMSWTEVDSPVISGDAAGNTSITMTGNSGLITGGDLMVTNDYTPNSAVTTDGGKTWQLTNTPVTKGAFYCGSYFIIENQPALFLCGPNGLDYSKDLGESWAQLDSANLWGMDFMGNFGFAVGRGGIIKKITLK